jgi:hypothetical protein
MAKKKRRKPVQYSYLLALNMGRAIARTGTIISALNEYEISRQTYLNWRKANPEFDAVIEIALACYREGRPFIDPRQQEAQKEAEERSQSWNQPTLLDERVAEQLQQPMSGDYLNPKALIDLGKRSQYSYLKHGAVERQYITTTIRDKDGEVVSIHEVEKITHKPCPVPVLERVLGKCSTMDAVLKLLNEQLLPPAYARALFAVHERTYSDLHSLNQQIEDILKGTDLPELPVNVNAVAME